MQTLSELSGATEDLARFGAIEPSAASGTFFSLENLQSSEEWMVKKEQEFTQYTDKVM